MTTIILCVDDDKTELLIIARKIVDKHHGRIDLHSATGLGTTFTVWLPLQQPASGAARAVAETAHA